MSPNYFLNWSEAETVLSRAVDGAFDPLVDHDILYGLRITIPILRVDQAVPVEYRPMINAVLNEFLPHVILSRLEMIRFTIRDRYTGCRMNEETLTRIKEDVIDFLSEPLAAYGIPPRDVLKGLLGIPPYHHNVPGEVHDRITNVILLYRMGIEVTGERMLDYPPNCTLVLSI